MKNLFLASSTESSNVFIDTFRLLSIHFCKLTISDTLDGTDCNFADISSNDWHILVVFLIVRA